MVHAVRRGILSLALAALAAADGYGQAPEPSPAPARLAAPSATPPAPDTAPCAAPPLLSPVPMMAPLACAPYEDQNGPLLWGNPLLDQPQFHGPGWIFAVEAGGALPTFRSARFTFPVQVGGVTHDVAPPLAVLNWTVIPKVELGYRLPAGFGEFLVSYRNITSQGNATVGGFDPAGVARVHSRLNFNVIDLLYASHESSLGPAWDMRWDTGIRLAGLYFDTQGAGPTLEQRATSNFLGGGVTGGLGLYRTLSGLPGLSLGGRASGAYLLGNTYQAFEEVQTPPGAAPAGGASRFNEGTGAATLALQVGVTYQPGGPDGRVRIESGYQYEKWWSVAEAFANRGDLEVQTLFLRLTYNY